MNERRGVDMRPMVEDELNAAWAEVNKARAEAQRLREALQEANEWAHELEDVLRALRGMKG
jgi:hypothetical protein